MNRTIQLLLLLVVTCAISAHLIFNQSRPVREKKTNAFRPELTENTRVRSSHASRRGVDSKLAEAVNRESSRPDAPSSDADPIAASSSAPHDTSPVVQQAGVPVSLAITDLGLPQITPNEMELLQSLKARFESTIALAPSQDPDDPEYFDYWKKARVLNDKHLRARIGSHRYDRLFSLASAHQAGR